MIDELQCGIQIIASGVLRTGLEAAQAIRLGASLAGFAAQLLPAAVEGAESLNAAISKLMTELRIAAFCTGSASIAELKRAVILRASATQRPFSPASRMKTEREDDSLLHTVSTSGRNSGVLLLS